MKHTQTIHPQLTLHLLMHIHLKNQKKTIFSRNFFFVLQRVSISFVLLCKALKKVNI